MATGGVARLVCGRWSKWIVLALWIVVLAVAAPMARQAERRREERQLGVAARQCRGDQGLRSAEAVLARRHRTGRHRLRAVRRRSPPPTRPRRPPTRSRSRCRAACRAWRARWPGRCRARTAAALETIVPIKVDAAGWDKIVDSTDAIKKITGTGGDGLKVYLTGPAGNAADSAGRVQRHRRHAALHHADRGRADPADHLPQPDPVAAPDHVRRRRADQRAGRHLPAGQARRAGRSTRRARAS